MKELIDMAGALMEPRFRTSDASRVDVLIYQITHNGSAVSIGIFERHLGEYGLAELFEGPTGRKEGFVIPTLDGIDRVRVDNVEVSPS